MWRCITCWYMRSQINYHWIGDELLPENHQTIICWFLFIKSHIDSDRNGLTKLWSISGHLLCIYHYVFMYIGFENWTFVKEDAMDLFIIHDSAFIQPWSNYHWIIFRSSQSSYHWWSDTDSTKPVAKLMLTYHQQVTCILIWVEITFMIIIKSTMPFWRPLSLHQGPVSCEAASQGWCGQSCCQEVSLSRAHIIHTRGHQWTGNQ